MKPIHSIAVLMFMIFCQSAFADFHLPGDYVGNGGDGITIGNALFLRDFLEGGVENSAWFGTEIDTTLMNHSLLLPPFTASARELLVRKLTDLNRFAPGLGDYLLSALTMYTYNLVQTPLALLDPDGDILNYPPDSRVQIANRMDGTITIHQPSWELMTPENQAGLLLHEAIYSVLRPRLGTDGYMAQSAKRTREIVAFIFSEQLERFGYTLLPRILRDELAVPSDPIPETRRELFWDMTVGPADGSSVTLGFHAYELQGSKNLEQLATLTCETLIKNENLNPNEHFTLTSAVQISAVDRSFVEYNSNFGRQLYVQIETSNAMPISIRTINGSEGMNACRLMMREHMRLVAQQF